MSATVEYLFATDSAMADRAARKHGWRPRGRAGWIKPDGKEVHFICFIEQLAIVGKDMTIYYVGELSPELLRSDRKWMKLRA
jgi:hypothetical protein